MIMYLHQTSDYKIEMALSAFCIQIELETNV